MADRPRRSTRQAIKQQPSTARAESAGPSTEPNAKTKSRTTRGATTAAAAATAADPKQWLKALLQSPKSLLTTIDLSDIFNAGAWEMLSDAAREELKTLLPPTAFIGYKHTLGGDHPAASSLKLDAMEVDTSEVDASSFLTEPHFLAASRTFQDHLYSDWLSDAHHEKVSLFQQRLRDGTLAVPWKDDQWLTENPPLGSLPEQDQPNNALARTASWNLTLAGGATQIKLSTLVERGIIRVGDILAYRRVFTGANVTVEKDVIVDSIHPTTHALTVLTVIGRTKALPIGMVVKRPKGKPSTGKEAQDASTSIRSISVTGPSMLESGLLDIDGRIDKSHRPNGNAWKTFSVWRWRAQSTDVDAANVNGRGGRENHGTLFYLRGNFYHEEY